MKSHVSSQMFRRSGEERGIALVIVLSMLVLLSALLVAFMSSATTELNATQAATAGSTARQIADSTVNLVIGNIREATTQANENVSWASQPGAIRTFSGSLTSTKKDLNKEGSFAYKYSPGPNDFVYKLYSTDRLKVPMAEFSNSLAIETGVIENWEDEKPVDYVDLNEPILSARFDLDPDGKTVEPRYPVIDPRAMYSVNGSQQVSTADPAVVEGFDAKISLDTNQMKLAESGDTVPYLPLPVKWLYVLKDGTIGSAELASAENPIVGRTAFWTDDESCKLNINTASEGTFWDTPSVSTEQESGNVSGSRALSSSQFSLSLATSSPVSGEYQRYPGHPYSTCLSPVLGSLWGLAPTMSLYPNHNRNYQAYKEAIYKISPFTPNGRYTTRGATVNPEPDMPFDGSRPKHTVDTKRLYATVDELIFKSARNNGGANPTPALNDFTKNFTPEALEKTRFFLTANSRAPELNLFGRPRVTIWPINEDPRIRTRFDDLFAFASTIAKTNDETTDKKYFLTRRDSKSSYADYNAQNRAMYRYLQNLTRRNIPGFGAEFVGAYPKYQDTNMDQILTETLDYVRTVNLVDTGEASNSQNIFIPYTPRFYPDGVDQTYSRRSRAFDWSGQVTPLKIDPVMEKANKVPTQGMGRFVTLSEASLLFERIAGGGGAGVDQLRAILLLEMSTVMPGYPGLKDTYWTRVTNIEEPNEVKRLQFQFMATKKDSPMIETDFCTQLSGLVNIVNVGTHEVSFGRAFMPTFGFTNSMFWFPMHRGNGLTRPELYPNAASDPNFNQTGGADPNVKTFNWQDPNSPTANNIYTKSNLSAAAIARCLSNYPYVSRSIPIPKNDTTPDGIGNVTGFRFTGPRLKIEIFAGQTPSDIRGSTGLVPQPVDPVPVQTITVEFPDVTATLSLPTATGSAFASRFSRGLDSGWNILNGSGFVIRSMEFTGPVADKVNGQGDLRLGAALANVPKSYFQPRDYLVDQKQGWNKNVAQIHGLQSSHGDPFTGHTAGLDGRGANAGRLTVNGSNRSNKPPILPRGVNGVQRLDNPNAVGDFDRGISKHMDGAFGNKVDEGNLKYDMSASNYSRLPYYRGRGIEETGQSFFTPNRLLPSAVMFGSLPTGLDPKDPENAKPWQTLLFRPDRENGKSHPGAANPALSKPADHLYLDLFHMPVVEPYAISEPFSTAGKVNMNYVIAPFGYAKGQSGANPGMQSARSYLRRDSALRGVLRSTWMMAVPTGADQMAHHESPTNNYYRFPIDLDKTIDQFEYRLNDQKQGIGARDTTLFRSASEICDIDLFPKSTQGGPAAPIVSNWSVFWNTQYAGTGDNMRERPYAHIYPRLTTKSNVYTVYMRCQAIKKSPKSDPKEFDPEKDLVVSEYRGSATIERFIDPNDKALLDYDEMKSKVEPYYRFRVVNTKHFAAQ